MTRGAVTETLVRDKETGLIEVFTNAARDAYFLRNANDPTVSGFIQVIPRDIRPAVFIRLIGGIDPEADYKIDSTHLRDKHPTDCNAYIPGESIQFRLNPTIEIQTFTTPTPEIYSMTGDIEGITSCLRAINFCKVTIPKGYE